ncbi:MAG: translation elongation factor Ts [bacterium]|nr:translation elongation factor Ts [bacterium]
MEISADIVKKLRDKTNAGMMDCKKALQEAGGDLEKATDLLRKRGLAIAAKKSSRATKEGVIAAYIHSNNKVGVLVEVCCESDFVAKNAAFQAFVKDLTLQIASAVPRYVSREQVPEEVLEREKAIYREQVTGKPAAIVEKIVAGKLEKFYQEVCLLDQPFVKEDKRTIGDLLKELIAKLGENIVIRRFVRYQVGEET